MTVEERIENLEWGLAKSKRQNRRLVVAGAVLLAGATFFLAAWARPVDVRARSFILVDQDGRTRAQLVIEKEGPKLVLGDENGNIRAGLNANTEGTGLFLFDENGKTRVMLGATSDGPGLFLDDENGKTRATLGAIKDGQALFLYDKNGKVFWSAP